MGGGSKGVGGLKWTLPPNVFAKLVKKGNKTSQPSLKTFGKNLMDPAPGFSNGVHLYSKCTSCSQHESLNWDISTFLETLKSLSLVIAN